MNLRNIIVSLQDDGFAIVDSQGIVSAGTPLRIRFELTGGWTTKDIEFEVTDRPTLFHPFRKRSMFVYTGEKPVRVIVQEVPDPSKGQWGARMARGDFDRQSFLLSRNFQTFPEYDSQMWLGDDYLPISLGVMFEDATDAPQSMPEDVDPPVPADGGAGDSDFVPVQADDGAADDHSDDLETAIDFPADQDSGEPNAY